jgi:hypothetical protein
MSPANQKLKPRRLLEAGRKLLDSDEPVRTHEEFNNWVDEVDYVPAESAGFSAFFWHNFETSTASSTRFACAPANE